MTEEVNVPAEVTAPEQVETASTETEVTAAPDDKANEAPKTFTQEELDAAIGKRLAREQRKWEREQQQRLAEAMQTAQKPQGELKQEQFEDTQAYAEALALQKAEQLLAARERQRQEQEALAAFHDKEEEARNKYDDFEQVAYNPRLPITDVMAQTIQASDVGPDVAYYLGQNIKEAERIARLSPILQAKEIGKIEAKLSTNPPQVKKTTNAPAPINPVKAKSSGVPTYDLDDPRSLEQLGPSAWIEARREQQRKSWESGKR